MRFCFCAFLVAVSDIIHDAQPDPEAEGWCKGTLNGKTGVFPDNFVEKVEAPPPAKAAPAKPPPPKMAPPKPAPPKATPPPADTKVSQQLVFVVVMLLLLLLLLLLLCRGRRVSHCHNPCASM